MSRKILPVVEFVGGPSGPPDNPPGLTTSAKATVVRRSFMRRRKTRPRMDVIDRSGRLTVERPRDRRQIHLVRDAEVIEALTDAPGVRRGLPVDLLSAESSGDVDGVPIVCREVSDQPVRPG